MSCLAKWMRVFLELISYQGGFSSARMAGCTEVAGYDRYDRTLGYGEILVNPRTSAFVVAAESYNIFIRSHLMFCETRHAANCRHLLVPGRIHSRLRRRKASLRRAY